MDGPEEVDDFQSCQSEGSQDDLQEWLDAETDTDVDVDSEIDPLECMDGIGELKSFSKPVDFGTSISIIFMVGNGSTMAQKDVSGASGSRLEAAQLAMKQFIEQQRRDGAVQDVYSLLTFNNIQGSEVHFARRSADEATRLLGHMKLCAATGLGNLVAVLEGIRSTMIPTQTTRVIILSDAIRRWLPRSADTQALQELMAESPNLDIHTVGFGTDNFFLSLQQIAQIGRGSFSNAATDMSSLTNTFTTISSSITQTRDASHNNERAMRPVAFENAGIAHYALSRHSQSAAIAPSLRHAIRCTYELRHGRLRVQNQSATRCWIRKQPFMQGGMRLVYAFADVELVGVPMVAKFSKYEENDASFDYVEPFLRNTATARSYGNQFHNAIWAAWGYKPRRLVSIAKCWSYRLSGPGTGELFVAEPFLRGAENGFLKWVNNRGEVLVPPTSWCHTVVVEAFVHFTLVASSGKHMVSDIQGVLHSARGSLRGVHLTDPQVASEDQGFGSADLGTAAMQKFMSLHTCNALCRKLHLPAGVNIAKAPQIRRVLGGTRGSMSSSLRSQVPPPSGPFRGRSPERRGAMPVGLAASGNESMTIQELLMLDSTHVRKLLFVGECTHLFSSAAARFVATKCPALGTLDWWSTELRWPSSSNMQNELARSRALLERFGIRVMEGVDATDMHLNVQGLEGAVWSMPYPHLAIEQSSKLSKRMQSLAVGFVSSAAELLETKTGTISMIFMAMQHLAWKLAAEIQTSQGTFVREVFWLDIAPLLGFGYQPRYGDDRDQRRQASYHTQDAVVVARWRLKRDAFDHPRGMTDARVRSGSASRRSQSRSASPAASPAPGCSPRRG